MTPSKSAVPKYLRVKQDLISAIVSGRYSVGGPFPTEAQLVLKYGVSRPTLVRSLQELVRDGYLHRHQGRGTIVADYRARRPNMRLPLFVNEAAARLSGGARQVLLRITNGVERALGQSRTAMGFYQIPQGVLDDKTRQLVDEVRPRVALVIESSFNNELMAYLRACGCMTLTINQPMSEGNCVYIDQEHAGYLATKHLLNRGRRKIAILNGPLGVYWGFEAREAGYRQAYREAGLSVDEKLVRHGADAIDSEAGRSMMRELIAERAAMDGVVGVSDSKAMGAMNAAREAGLSIPDDLLFVSIDNTIADQADPPITSVAMPFEEVGRQAALHAMDWQNLPEGSTPVGVNISLKPTVVVRD